MGTNDVAKGEEDSFQGNAFSVVVPGASSDSIPTAGNLGGPPL